MMWKLDLDDNKIILQFESPSLDPANNGMAIDCTAMLIGSITGNISTAVRLLSSVEGLQVNETTATCDLGMQFRATLNDDSSLGIDPNNNTLLLYYESSGAIGGDEGILLMDSSGTTYLDETGTIVTEVVPDITIPAIASFQLLDLNEGIMVFSFTKPVNVSTFNFADLSLQNSPVNEATSINISLTGGTCVDGFEIGRRVTLQMTLADLDQLKVKDICISISTCYPHHTDMLVKDFGENSISTYRFGLNYLLQHLILDTTNPLLITCSLDLSMDNLVLMFDEPIDIATFNPSSITLQDFSENIILSSASSVMGPSNPIIVVNLGLDADKVKTSTLSISGINTSVSVLSSAFEDIAGNSVQPTSSLACDDFTFDNHPPIVTSFNLDLNSNLLHIVFNEPVLVHSLILSGFKLVDSTGTNNITLDDSCLFDCEDSPADDAVRMIFIAFGSQSLTRIKTDDTIGTTINNTYLLIDDFSFTDTNGNDFVSTGPIGAAAIIADNSPATAIDFSLDMNIGQIVLTFNDVVDVSTWYNQETFIQRAAFTYNSKQGLSGIVSGTDSNVVAVNITNINSLKQRLNYGTAIDLNTTYLTIRAHAINDIRSVDIIAVTDGNGIIANNYVRDSESPQLMYFNLDMDNGRLYFYFDEPIASNSFNLSLFTLQGDSMVNTSSSSVNLSTSSSSYLSSCCSFYLYLPSDTLYILRRNPNIARNAETTNLVIMHGGVTDTSGNPLNMTGPVNVRSYTPSRSK